MRDTVLDIATGKKIDETKREERRQKTSGDPWWRVLEIAAPDGRTIFSISRLLNGSKHALPKERGVPV